MKHILVGCLLSLFILSAGGPVTTRGQAEGSEMGDRTVVALDLMDLELPGEDDGDQMELPPIGEPGSPDKAPPRPGSEPPAPRLEGMGTETPASAESAGSPEPGIAPFLLEGTRERPGSTRPAATSAEGLDAEIPLDEIPTELKAVTPPPSRADSLKLPSGADASGSGEPDIPEIPLLTTEDARGRETSVSGEQDSSPTLKPLSDLYGTSGAGSREAPAQAGRQQEDYLQVREDIDARLIEIYERFYEDR